MGSVDEGDILRVSLHHSSACASYAVSANENGVGLVRYRKVRGRLGKGLLGLRPGHEAAPRELHQTTNPTRRSKFSYQIVISIYLRLARTSTRSNNHRTSEAFRHNL